MGPSVGWNSESRLAVEKCSCYRLSPACCCSARLSVGPPDGLRPVGCSGGAARLATRLPWPGGVARRTLGGSHSPSHVATWKNRPKLVGRLVTEDRNSSFSGKSRGAPSWDRRAARRLAVAARARCPFRIAARFPEPETGAALVERPPWCNRRCVAMR